MIYIYISHEIERMYVMHMNSTHQNLMQDLYSLPYLDSIMLALGQSSNNIINMSLTQYFIMSISINYAKMAMCHKFLYII